MTWSPWMTWSPSMVDPSSRRLAIIEITYEFIAAILLAQGDGPDIWVTHDLPDDLEVLSVRPGRDLDTMALLLGSKTFAEVPVSELPPVLRPKYTRHWRLSVDR